MRRAEGVGCCRVGRALGPATRQPDLHLAILSRIEQWQELQGKTRVFEIVSASKEITFFNITKQGKIYNQTKIMRLQSGM